MRKYLFSFNLGREHSEPLMVDSTNFPFDSKRSFTNRNPSLVITRLKEGYGFNRNEVIIIKGEMFHFQVCFFDNEFIQGEIK